MYSSYTAASFARKLDLARKHKANLQGALTWAFQFEDQPYFAGFRALASNGIDLPVLNVFRMFSHMSGIRLQVTSSADAGLETMLKRGVRGTADVSALASMDGNKLRVMAWHYHDDDVPGPMADVELVLSGLPVGDADARLTHYRIDAQHSNAYELWKRMGQPEAPDQTQYAELEQAGKLALLRSPEKIRISGGKGTLSFALPRQGVSLLELDLKP